MVSDAQPAKFARLVCNISCHPTAQPKWRRFSGNFLTKHLQPLRPTATERTYATNSVLAALCLVPKHYDHLSRLRLLS